MSSPSMSPARTVVERRFSPLLCAVWVLVGAIGSFALAATFTPLILLVVPVGIVGLLLIRRRGFTLEMVGLAGGLILVIAVATALS